jgi:hypothetical protein
MPDITDLTPRRVAIDLPPTCEYMFVSKEFVDDTLADWSEPVQAKILRRPENGPLELVFRRVENGG